LAVKLRLKRMGKKKQPIYKVVAADSRSPRDGKFLEAIGLYNPLTNPHTLEINEVRALYWLGVGAQPTNTVKSLLSQKGILLKKELLKKEVSEEKMNEEMSNWQKLKEAGNARKSKPAKKEKVSEPVKATETSAAEAKGAASEEKAE